MCSFPFQPRFWQPFLFDDRMTRKSLTFILESFLSNIANYNSETKKNELLINAILLYIAIFIIFQFIVISLQKSQMRSPAHWTHRNSCIKMKSFNEITLLKLLPPLLYLMQFHEILSNIRIMKNLQFQTLFKHGNRITIQSHFIKCSVSDQYQQYDCKMHVTIPMK